MEKLTLMPIKNVQRTIIYSIGYILILGGYVYLEYVKYEMFDAFDIIIIGFGVFGFLASLFLAYNRRIVIHGYTIQGAFREWPDHLEMLIKDEYTKRSEPNDSETLIYNIVTDGFFVNPTTASKMKFLIVRASGISGLGNHANRLE